MFFAKILIFKGLNSKVYRRYLYLLRKKHIVSIAYSKNVYYFYRSIPHKRLLIYDGSFRRI